MRSKAAAIALAVAFSTTLTSAAVFLPQEAQAQSRRGYDMFYDDLAQDGRWVDHPRYGWVWYPTRVRSDWRPYSDGRWRWTDRYGWYWESNERFGWATYHYGRWGYDDQYGHIWVPGDEWAPAWVSFRDSDDAIGWAPLPPETLGMTLLALLAGGRSSSYYRYVDMSDSYYQPRWTFVPTRYFTNDRIYTHAYSWRDNDRYYRSSRNVTNYITVNNYYVNRSIDPRRWESRTGQRIETVNVREASSRDEWRQDRERRDERNLTVFNPRIERDRDGRSAPPPAVRATATDKPVVQVQREWAAPEERRDRPNTRDEWRQRYSQGDRDGNDRDRNAQGQNERDRNDRDRTTDRDGRPTTTPGGATPATPATRATPADPGVNPATRATPATPATPPDRNARQPDRERNDRAQQQREQQERAQQERAQQQREQQEKIQQQRSEQQRQQQEKIQQQRAEQERAQQQRAQQQREQQEKIQQQRQQQQEKVQQQREQQQERVQQQRQQQQEKEKVQQQRQQPERAQRARQPEQATKPEPRQPEQRQQPQRGKQEQRGGGNECQPNQPNCR